MEQADKFNQVVNLIQQLNGVSKKTAERLVTDLIIHQQKISSLKEAFSLIENSFGECLQCYYFTIDGRCPICSDLTRNQNQILVVSSLLDAKNIEQSRIYHGLYAIIKGEINLSKGFGPEKLKLGTIFNRLHWDSELILALNTTFNGEVTANYLKDLALQQGIKVSRIAKGIPHGGLLSSIDKSTLGEAIENRIKNE